MPASYAHYRFGKMLLPELPADARQCISRFRRMYDMGLQGPDFFFFHNPLIKSTIGALGYSYHRQTGREFFSHAVSAAASEAATAYLYGVLGHYALDTACHSYVNRMVETGEASHVLLESEFDRFLMAADGIAEPHTYTVSSHIKLTRGESLTVAAFYPPATGAQVYHCTRNMARSLDFLAGGNRASRAKLLSRFKPSLLENMIPERPVEAYARMDSELLARFNQALKDYMYLLPQLKDYMKINEALGEDFDASFNNGRIGPVLPPYDGQL